MAKKNRAADAAETTVDETEPANAAEAADETDVDETESVDAPLEAPRRVVARAKCRAQVAHESGYHTYRGGEIETDPRRVETLKTMPESFSLIEVESADHLDAVVEKERDEFERLRAMCAEHGFVVHRHGDRCPE